MSKPKSSLAPIIPISSAYCFRQLRAERARAASGQVEPESDPLEVLELMIDGYFHALLAQLTKVKAHRRSQ